MYRGDPVTLTMHVHYLFILSYIEKHIKPLSLENILKGFSMSQVTSLDL